MVLCLVGMTNPAARTGRNRSASAADTARHFRSGRPACRPGSGHRGRIAVSGVTRRVRWLGEPIAGPAAAGRMQPAPVGTAEPGGQAGAKLVADVGHGRAW
jgi:hypothetical protein